VVAAVGAGEESAARLFRKSWAVVSGERLVLMSMELLARQNWGRFGWRWGQRFGQETGKWRAVVGQRFHIIALDFIINLLAMDRHLLGRLNADFDHVALQPDNFHDDAAVNYDAFARFAR
jgi:hypothetical protein